MKLIRIFSTIFFVGSLNLSAYGASVAVTCDSVRDCCRNIGQYPSCNGNADCIIDCFQGKGDGPVKACGTSGNPNKCDYGDPRSPTKPTGNCPGIKIVPNSDPKTGGHWESYCS